MTVLLAALGAAIGAPLRYLADRFVQQRHDSKFPWGTFAVNVAACLLLGLLSGFALPGWARALAATGVLGALSTYSTFGYETFVLLRERERLLAFANMAASLAAGLGALLAGLLAAALLTGAA
ncbi:fluoride efflux transporter FluC [Streptomonospora litoralis]|uniref:Fluoride-specific ion channel FluC n=1 Tax=Streptomonospora litoralis TaxID=2498135 RepID=A0A4P6PVH1_9ACTN|nr:CrcB family protein [Streptomonospora litoralis]QBI52045.1 camphor resistance protein CrcB [Streptomonospora litoralis]